jgi:hypothetical protein
MEPKRRKKAHRTSNVARISSFLASLSSRLRSVSSGALSFSASNGEQCKK